ncbi:helicase-related protein [Pseudarthrobacter sp. R1]|uniref:helicase-related protein n=1 Tax=Pseudarthrobacter sp. R1 TaxID=2944934 RepID=UPI0035A976A5
MAEVFNRAGIASVAVDGSTDNADREEALKRLGKREINCIFAVDLFNEGLDLPQVDTILLLRPTQSATVFLQQLGRGLRRAEGKAVLTVLDFIGQQRREFRFDLRYRALTGYGRKELEKAVEDEFPYLRVSDRWTTCSTPGRSRSRLLGSCTGRCRRMYLRPRLRWRSKGRQEQSYFKDSPNQSNWKVPAAAASPRRRAWWRPRRSRPGGQRAASSGPTAVR